MWIRMIIRLSTSVTTVALRAMIIFRMRWKGVAIVVAVIQIGVSSWLLPPSTSAVLVVWVQEWHIPTVKIYRLVTMGPPKGLRTMRTPR